MKKRKTIIYLMAVCLFCLSAKMMANEIGAKEKALQALNGEDYRTAINICRSQLESDPDNYEFTFILSRAYAYSGQWDQAFSLLTRMLELYPDNLDILLFRSRIRAWEGNYDEADAGFRSALAIDPENKEALIGRAEIASWKKEFSDAREKYRKILQLDPDDPDLYFRLGRIYHWDGNYSEARRYYRRASELDPENTEYIRALKGAHPDFMNDYELRVQYQNEGFSDDRGNYIDHHVVFSIKVSPDIGFLHLKYNRTHRYGKQDSQFGIELYPHLWEKAYGYVDLDYSPKAVHYPRTSYLFEVYQSFLQAAEISLGYRRMNFANEAVSVYLGSFGYYLGNLYPFLRWYYTPEDEGDNFSWTMNVRRYFTKDSYLALGYGQGSRPFDIITSEDILVRKSWIFLAEWNWYFWERIRLKVQFTHRNEKDGPTRNAIFVATGYRW
jgi:YaiO family outer membrane protein